MCIQAIAHVHCRHSLSKEITDALIEQTEARQALNVVGLMNVQFAVKDNEIYLIEVTRVRRVLFFVAKATDSAIASIAVRLTAGELLTQSVNHIVMFPTTKRSPLTQ